MVKNRGIAFKLILLCCASSAFIFLVIFGYTYRFSRDTIEKDTKERAISLAQNAVNRIETILRSVENVPEGVASVLENCTLTRREMVSLLRASVRDNPEIYGAILAFEPFALDGKTRYFAPYFYRHDGAIKATDPDTRAHFEWSWYRNPKQSEHPEWSEPYFDSGFGKTVMATYSVPLYRTDKGIKQFRGVVTADISLDQLSEIVSSIKILETGFGVLISKNGTIVTHPNRNLIMKETIAGLAEKAGDKSLQDVGRRMMAGESGFTLPGPGFGETVLDLLRPHPVEQLVPRRRFSRRGTGTGLGSAPRGRHRPCFRRACAALPGRHPQCPLNYPATSGHGRGNR